GRLSRFIGARCCYNREAESAMRRGARCVMAEKKPNDIDPRETSPLRPDALRGASPAERLSGAKTGHLPAPWRLLVQIGEQNQTTVGLEVKGELILGRADPMANVQPDLDLTPY